MATRSGPTLTSSLGSPSLRSSPGTYNNTTPLEGNKKVQKNGDLVIATLRDIKGVIVKIVNINVEKNNNNTNTSIKINPFGSTKEQINIIESKLKFLYNSAEKGEDDVYFKQLKECTPDLSKAVLNRFEIKAVDTLYPAALKLQANKEEFNNQVFTDPKGNVIKIACVIPRNHAFERRLLFEQPEHTVQQRGLFLVKHPGLCGDEAKIYQTNTHSSGQISVLDDNPLWDFLELHRKYGKIDSVSHPHQQESDDVFRVYHQDDFNKIASEALERKNKVLNVIDLKDLSFTLSRLDGNSLADSVGTVHQLNSNDFHSVRNFTISFTFEISISVVVSREYLDASMVRKLKKCPQGIDIDINTVLSIPGLETSENEKDRL